MLEHLREEVLEANLELVRQGLVLYTFGNVSGIARPEGLVVIKPSGVPYEQMKPEHLVVTDMEGKVVEGKMRPSSDLPTHLVLYKQFTEIGGVAHTHSEYATAWAQARKPIPCFGTTHADYFHGPVPVTSEMTDQEIAARLREKHRPCDRSRAAANECFCNSGHTRSQPRPFRLGSGCRSCHTPRCDSGSDRAHGIFHSRHPFIGATGRRRATRQALP